MEYPIISEFLQKGDGVTQQGREQGIDRQGERQAYLPPGWPFPARERFLGPCSLRAPKPTTLASVLSRNFCLLGRKL